MDRIRPAIRAALAALLLLPADAVRDGFEPAGDGSPRWRRIGPPREIR